VPRKDLLGNTDRLDFTLLVQFLHLFPCTWDISFGNIGVVDEVKVDVFNTELLEWFLAWLTGVFVVEARPLGSEPVLFSGETRLFQSLSDFLFVVIDWMSAVQYGMGQTADWRTLSGIDVIESDVNRLVYLAGTDIFRDLPRSETDLGDLSTVVQSDLVEWHDDCK
jgi:hypothetical protein